MATEKHITINPSWVIQFLVGTVLAVLGWLLTSQLDRMIEAQDKLNESVLDVKVDIASLDGKVDTTQALTAQHERDLSDLQERVRQLEMTGN